MTDTPTIPTIPTEPTAEVVAATAARSIPIKAAVLFGAVCYGAGILVGVKAAQLVKAPCHCEEEKEAVVIETTFHVEPDSETPDAETVMSDGAG